MVLRPVRTTATANVGSNPTPSIDWKPLTERMCTVPNDDNLPAFPESYIGNDAPHEGVGGGMTMRQYACIHLRVPRSGQPWLDELIIEAQRNELAAKAMEARIVAAFSCQDVFAEKERQRMGSAMCSLVAQSATQFADAMLKAQKETQPCESK
jgi:hypothetical protein